MQSDIQQALDEIMDLSPIDRQVFVVKYLKEYLPQEDARVHLFRKTKKDFLKKMMAEGYVTKEELFAKIGRDRIAKFYRILNGLS